MIAIGDTSFRQTQFRGNGMTKLRKRIGKWSYVRWMPTISIMGEGHCFLQNVYPFRTQYMGLNPEIRN